MPTYEFTRFRKFRVKSDDKIEYAYMDRDGAKMSVTVKTSPLSGQKCGGAFRGLRLEVSQALDLTEADLSKIIPTGIEFRKKENEPAPEARIFAERHLDAHIQKLETPWLCLADRGRSPQMKLASEQSPLIWSDDTTGTLLALADMFLTYIEKRVQESMAQSQMFNQQGLN